MAISEQNIYNVKDTSTLLNKIFSQMVLGDGTLAVIGKVKIKGSWFPLSLSNSTANTYPFFPKSQGDEDIINRDYTYNQNDCYFFRSDTIETFLTNESDIRFAYVLKRNFIPIIEGSAKYYPLEAFEKYTKADFISKFPDFRVKRRTGSGTNYSGKPITLYSQPSPRTEASSDFRSISIPVSRIVGGLEIDEYFDISYLFRQWSRVGTTGGYLTLEQAQWTVEFDDTMTVLFTTSEITSDRFTMSDVGITATSNGERIQPLFKPSFIETLFGYLGIPFAFSATEAINDNISDLPDYHPIDFRPFKDDYSGESGGDGTFDKTNNPIIKDNSTITGVVGYLAEGNDMFTVYNPNDDQMQALGDYFWGTDLPTVLSKWFIEPLDSIITWRRVPYVPSSFGDETTQIIVGPNLDTGILTNIVTRQYETYDMGSYELKEYFGSFLDYAPYTQIQLYLPFVGFIELKPEEVMNSTLNVVYYIDNLTGAFNAQLNITKDDVQRTIYNREGKFGAEIPLTGVNYRDIIRDTINGVTKFVSGGVNALSGNYSSALSDVGSGISAVMGAKVTPQRTGGMSAEMGVFNYGRVFLLITRPNPSIPDNYGHQYGYPSNIYSRLGDLSGYTEVGSIHLDGIDCTTDERDMIDTQLKNGVIL